MQPRIENFRSKRLYGRRLKMSFSNNKTLELWRNFIPGLKELGIIVGSELYSVEVYDTLFFDNFNPETEFEKWAAIELKNFDKVPYGMEIIIIPTGLYAVFLHRGPASTGTRTYQYIFGTWLPNSGFLLDNRPHFALMSEKYKHEDAYSEEELWIPVKTKE